MEVDLHDKVEQLKRDLEMTPGYSIRRCFKAIDETNCKFIDESALRRFLKKVGHRPTKEELVSIMRRFDLDGDHKVTFPEFAEALTPIVIGVSRHAARSIEGTIEPY